MDYVEEKTPRGILIKILFKKWQFLAFDRKGKPVYTDQEGRSLVHKVPLIIFIGSTFGIVRDYEKKYLLLKIRNGSIIVPYIDNRDKMKKYFFIPTDKTIDMIPVQMLLVNNVAQLVRDVEIDMEPDHFVVDDGITSNDIIIIKSRYKVEDIIYIELVNNYFLNERMDVIVDEKQVNINTMSSNPVYLAQIHLRSMDLAKLNQLLLDFDITALDTEFIVYFLEDLLNNQKENPEVRLNRKMLEDLRDSFKFYLYLLQRSDHEIRDLINSRTNVKTLAPFGTMISKVKSIYPGNEEQLLYTEYENMIITKKEELQKAPART